MSDITINKKEKFYSFGVAICSVLLIVICIVNNIWQYLRYNLEQGIECYATSYLVIHSICYFIVLLGCSVVTAALIKKIKTETIIKASVPIYAIILVASIIIANFVANKESLIFMNISTLSTVMLYLSLFVIVYLVSKYKVCAVRYLAEIFFLFYGIVFVLLFFGFKCMAVSIVMVLTMVFLSIKLVIDKKIPKKWMYILVIGISLPSFFELFMMAEFPSRFNLGSMSATQISIFFQALKKTPFFGLSSYNVSINEETAIPAYLYFAKSDIGYCFASPILRFGWISAIPYILALAGLIFFLIKIAKFANNNFSKYFIHVIVILYSVRICFTVLSCFIPINGIYLPFEGDSFSAIVDIIMCTSAVVLCNKKQMLDLDVIDKDCQANHITSVFIEDFKNMCVDIKKEFLSDELIRDDEINKLNNKINVRKIMESIGLSEKVVEYYINNEAPLITSFEGTIGIVREIDEKWVKDIVETIETSRNVLIYHIIKQIEDGSLIYYFLYIDDFECDLSEILNNLKEGIIDVFRVESNSNDYYSVDAYFMNNNGNLHIVNLDNKTPKKPFDFIAEKENNKEQPKEQIEVQPYEGEKPYIFISYSHKDYEDMISIAAYLYSEGYRVWFDDGIDPGTEWDENIASHINNCFYFFSLVSDNLINSKNCLDELSYARELDRNRLMIYLENVELPDGLKMRINRIQNIHKYKYDDMNKFFDKLEKTENIECCKTMDR